MARRRFEIDPGLDALVAAMASMGGAPRSSVAKPVAPRRSHLAGRVNLNHRGFAFVTTEEGDAFYAASELVRSLLTGDEVRFVPAPARKDSSGREIKALVKVHREPFLLLGEVIHEESAWRIKSDEPCFLQLNLAESDVLDRGVAAGEVVAVRIPAYDGPPRVSPIQVSIDRVMGVRERPGFAQDYALVKHGFQDGMPDTVIADAVAEASRLPEVVGDLADLTAIPFVTIDGESTRDFDDAVYASRVDGGWDVRIAIADVSWYVRPGSALDEWAASRCTSIYLPGRTVPMLPEALSTNCCALTQGDVRRAVVLTLRLDAAGQVQSRDIGRARIRSAARLTYNETAAFLDGRGARYAGEVEDSLAALFDVYTLLAAHRESQGKLDFDEPEPSLRQAPDGAWKLVWETRTEAHKLVEELMLLSNRVAAELLLARYGTGLFRHQPPPEEDDWQMLRTWALSCDCDLPDEPCMKALVRLVSSAPDADGVAAASHRVRACMRPAKYIFAEPGAEGGHFSLSFDWYTHFTSPIRRYADLLVHRLLLAPEDASLSAEAQERLARLVTHCSERAQASRLAERLVWDGLKLQNFIAEVPKETLLRARIVRITPRGLRVVIQGWQCAAWLPATNLRTNGFSFQDQSWAQASQEGVRARLQEGYALKVRWVKVMRDRPAYPELQVVLADEPPPSELAQV